MDKIAETADLITISLNGADNVGKTTQMHYLPECMEVRPGIHNYDDYMNDLVTKDGLREWWFTKSTNEELISTLMRAANQRAGAPSVKNFIMYDRGGIMFEAVCVATIAVKEKCDLRQSQATYQAIKEKLGLKFPAEDIRILLKHGQSISESVKLTLMREHHYDQVYEAYQELLQQQLEIQESMNMYTHVLNVTNLSIIQVQNKIRSIVRDWSRGKAEATTYTSLAPMFEHMHAIVAFGGMSESGKSSLAEGICKKLDIINMKCTRLKIAYFMELASAALGSDAYQLSEERQANLLVKQLNHYLSRHYWNKAATIESLHRLVCTQELKRILGDLLQIIYIDTSFDNRLQRSGANTEEVKKKDEVKISRGADKIKLEPGCFVLDNNNTTLDESINIVYEMLKFKNEKVASQAMLSQIYSGKINLFSHQFVLSAGSVLIHKSARQVCLIHQLEGKEEWLLPKGRKNVNETLQAAAVRETYEETGYHCSLMPLTMETRATPSDEHVSDVSRKVNNTFEPFMISLRRIGGKADNQKIIFWYVTQVDEDRPRQLNTQMINESFEAKLVSLDEANLLLAHDDDKELVQKAFELFYNTYPYS